MRILRAVLAAIAFLMAVVLAVVSSLYLLITPERIEQKLSALAAERWGVELRILGKVDVKVLPFLKISIPESELARSDGESMGGFGSARIQMNPLAFFAKSPSIKELNVDGLSIRLPNHFNASHGLEVKGGWTIEKLELSKSAVSREDIGVSFSDVYGTISEASESGALIDVSGRLCSNGRSYAVSIKTHYKIDDESATLIGTTISGTGITDKSVEFSINAAAVNLNSHEAVRLASLEYKTSNLGILKIEAQKILNNDSFELPAASISFAPEGEAIILEGGASASVSKDFKRVVLSGASLRSTTGETTLSGAMTAEENSGSASLSGVLFGTPTEISLAWGNSAAANELQEIMAQSYGNSPSSPSTKAEGGSSEVFIDGSISLGEVSLNPIFDSEILRRAADLPPSKFDLRISKAGRLSDIRAELVVKNSLLQIDELKAYLGSGSVDASTSFNLKSSEWTAEFSVSDAYGPMSGLPIDGAFSMIGTATGVATEATEFKTIIESKGGCLSGISISSIQKDLLEDRADAPDGRKGFETSDKTLYSNLNAELTLSRGILSAKAEVVGVDYWRMSLEQSAPSASFRTLDGLLFIGSPSIEVPISYSTDSDAWEIDWKKAQESVTQLYGEEPWTMDNATRKIMRKFNSLKTEAKNWLNKTTESSEEGEAEESESKAQSENKSFIDSAIECAHQFYVGCRSAVLEWMGWITEK